MSRLLRLFPREWRRRYGAEVNDLLAHSRRPARDRLDLILSAFHVHTERQQQLMRERVLVLMLMPVLACVLSAVGVLGAALSAGQLTNGFREIPGHWWSTLATFPLVIGVALAVLWWRVRRHEPPDRQTPQGS